MTNNFSTFSAAKILEVDPGSISNWIDDGRLNAYRTPGGHRRITTENLVTFLSKHNMPIPKQLDRVAFRVLIVDDEPEIIKLISSNIEMAHPDFEILRASDGFRAGMIASECNPDVVVLDIHMPGMDGFEVCKHLLAQNKGKKPDIIAVTGYVSDDVQERIVSCGARICLPKPIDFKLLMREIAVTNKA